MARNGSGTYDLPGADFTNGTLADADEVMEKFDDLATAMTASIAKDGQTTPTAALPMGNFNHTGVGVATARTHYARASQIADGALVYAGVAGGTADALTLTLSPAITAYVKGMGIDFVSGAAANTGAVTANANGVGSGAVTWPDGTALVANDIPANAAMRLLVAATTPVFHLQTQTRAPSTPPSPLTLTSTDAGAAAAPSLDLYRNSASPAASDEIGEVKFSGEDSAGNTDVYGRVFGSIVDPTSTSEDGRVNIETIVAGTKATRGYVQHGLVMGAALGADKGAGTVNAVSLYANGGAIASLLKGFIRGWGYANNGSDATNDIDIAAGSGTDSTGAYWMEGAALTKQLDAAWAVGTNAGGLDTGSIANTGYFIWAIARSDTGVVDALFSTSATAPTMPASYDYKRLIGYIERSGGAILAFLADELPGGGLRYRWDSPRLDGNNVALTTSYATLALSVPAGLRVLAFGNAVAPTGGNIINVRPVGAQDGTPSHTASPLATAGSTGTSTTTGGEWREFTDTSRTIEWAANASANAYLVTKGFEWARR